MPHDAHVVKIYALAHVVKVDVHVHVIGVGPSSKSIGAVSV